MLGVVVSKVVVVGVVVVVVVGVVVVVVGVVVVVVGVVVVVVVVVGVVVVVVGVVVVEVVVVGPHSRGPVYPTIRFSTDYQQYQSFQFQLAILLKTIRLCKNPTKVVISCYTYQVAIVSVHC